MVGMLAGRAAPPVWDSEYGTRQAAGSYKASSIIQSSLSSQFRHTVRIQLKLTAELCQTRKKDRKGKKVVIDEKVDSKGKVKR